MRLRNQPIARPALVFVEGIHRANNGEVYEFSRERVLNIAKNSNQLLQSGVPIPFQLHHKYDKDYNLGDVESPFVARPITQEDAQKSPSLGALVGRLGIFTDRLVAKTAQAIKGVANKTLNTLSAGICPVKEAIIEVSATPYPAIVGPTLFSSRNGRSSGLILFEDMSQSSPIEQNSYAPYTGMDSSSEAPAFTMEEALGLAQDKEQLLDEYETLAEALWRTLYSLHTASETELQGVDPYEASYNAMEYFFSELEVLFDLVDENQEQ